MLHLIFQSPLQLPTLQRIGKGDAVLFLENSVTHLLKNASYSCALETQLAANALFVLRADIETRGINANELHRRIEVIDYTGWVDLSVQHQPIVSWF
jgi:tRNA 2-thiouridine synthesizing protein B